MVIAKVRVDGVCAETLYCKPIPLGIIGVQVEFEYADPMWDGLEKTVVFRGSTTRDILNAPNIVTIPAEVVQKEGCWLSVGVYGIDADGTIAIPTLWAELGVIWDAADPSGDPSANPKLPIWAELKNDIDALKKLCGISAFGKEDSGKLLYISEDGSVQPLVLGSCLEIVNGVLIVTASGGEPVVVTVKADVEDGLLVLTDSNGETITAELSEDGLLTWPGVVVSVDDTGTVTFAKEE